MADFIDEVMGFDPTAVVFSEPESRTFDNNIYKTNPKDSKSDDGVYRSTVKIVYNPYNPKDSIVHQATYFLKSADGNRLVRSRLGNGPADPEFKNDPIFKGWKRLHFSENESDNKRAYDLFNKNENDYVIVQVLADENKPDLVGKFMAMKLPKAIKDKLIARMNPSKESKKSPYPVMDYVIGLELNMEVTPGPDDPSTPERKQREISYNICDFGDYAPIIKTDGTPLFDEEQLELIDNYVTAVKDSTGAKTEAKKKAATNQLEILRPQIKPLYQIAYDYVKENAFDLRDEQGWKEWDEQTAAFVNHWLEIVVDGYNPETVTYEDWKLLKGKGTDGVSIETTTTKTTNSESDMSDFGNPSDDLPF